MDRTETTSFIESIAQSDDAFDILERESNATSSDDLRTALLHCGIIPERYRHDSSEEKLWAKYCDVLLNRVFNHLNIQSEVIRVRGDSADIRGVADNYSIVADAKAFRLSRTAKNQKDFKVTALDDWRRNDTYASLVAPSFQYPTRSSQIYEQAGDRNVTLLSYVHIRFLLDFGTNRLEQLWNTARHVTSGKDARRYWETVDDAIVEITDASYEQLRRYKNLEIDMALEVAEEGIEYWESVKQSYHTLTLDEAISRLIQAEKIDQKIEFIRKVIGKLGKSRDG